MRPVYGGEYRTGYYGYFEIAFRKWSPLGIINVSSSYLNMFWDDVANLRVSLLICVSVGGRDV